MYGWQVWLQKPLAGGKENYSKHDGGSEDRPSIVQDSSGGGERDAKEYAQSMDLSHVASLRTKVPKDVDTKKSFSKETSVGQLFQLVETFLF